MPHSNPSTTEGKKKMRIRKFYGNSVIGTCITCGQEFQDNQIPREGYNHAKRTGHKVNIEISVVYHYN